MISTHPSAKQQLFDSVIGRIGNPIWLTYEIMFLALLTSHGLNGIKAIISDLNPPRSVNKVAAIAVLIVGILVFAYGSWVLLRATGRA